MLICVNMSVNMTLLHVVFRSVFKYFSLPSIHESAGRIAFVGGGGSLAFLHSGQSSGTDFA